MTLKSTFTVEKADNVSNIPTRVFDLLSDIRLTEDAMFHKLTTCFEWQ